jgi:hypothetical protein
MGNQNRNSRSRRPVEQSLRVYLLRNIVIKKEKTIFQNKKESELNYLKEIENSLITAIENDRETNADHQLSDEDIIAGLETNFF